MKLYKGEQIDMFIDLKDAKLNEGDDILHEKNAVPFIAGLKFAAEAATKSGDYNYRREMVRDKGRDTSVRFVVGKKAGIEKTEVK